jgi:putative flippase GtrA
MGGLADRRVVADFLRFGVVGFAGFLANTAVIYAVRGFLSLYAAGVLAWVMAATVTFSLNRAWTFRGRNAGRVHHQWLRFLAVNSVGFVLYYAIFSLLIAHFALCAAQPVLAVLGGVAVGMVANFTLSRKFVFG